MNGSLPGGAWTARSTPSSASCDEPRARARSLRKRDPPPLRRIVELDLVRIESVRIAASAEPGERDLVFFVLRVSKHAEKLLVALRASTVLRWAGACALDAERVG